MVDFSIHGVTEVTAEQYGATVALRVELNRNGQTSTVEVNLFFDRDFEMAMALSQAINAAKEAQK